MTLQTATIALLALLIIVVSWAALEVRGLHASLAPIATSPLARGLASIGS